MLSERKSTDKLKASKLPFGYYLERVANLLILRRSDSSFVAAFSARGADPFDIELSVWEDAD
jgi:hypothetical protein